MFVATQLLLSHHCGDSMLPSLFLLFLLPEASYIIFSPSAKSLSNIFSTSTELSFCARVSHLSLARWAPSGQMLIPGPTSCDKEGMATWYKDCQLRNFKEEAVMDILRHHRRERSTWQVLCMPVWCIWKGHPAKTFVRKLLISIFSLQEQQREPCRFHLIVMCFSEK